MTESGFPRSRPRRLRRTEALRALAAEASVRPEHLVAPHFVLPAESGAEPVPAMPGVARLGQRELVARVAEELELGIRGVLLFGLAEGRKDARGSLARDARGAVPSALRALRRELGDEAFLVTDVCLCGYTDHGHCGVLEAGAVANDATLPLLAETAVVHADAGASWVAPSDMMDGRVAAIRDALDAAGHAEVGILSYAVKYASSYYGPFRDAADSAPAHGDRRGYQMDPRNAREAEREALLDEAEGADMLMVKPALAYLDVIRRVRAVSRLPLAAYNVSGEYSMVKAAAERGWIDERAVVRENLLAVRRAGADVVITYHARDAVAGGWL